MRKQWVQRPQAEKEPGTGEELKDQRDCHILRERRWFQIRLESWAERRIGTLDLTTNDDQPVKGLIGA